MNATYYKLGKEHGFEDCKKKILEILTERFKEKKNIMKPYNYEFQEFDNDILKEIEKL